MGPPSRTNRRGTSSQQARVRGEERLNGKQEDQPGRSSSLGDNKIKKLEDRIGEIVTMLKTTPEERYAEAVRRRQDEASQSDEGNPDKTE